MKLQPHMILQQFKDSGIESRPRLLDTSEQEDESTRVMTSPTGLHEVENCDNEIQKKFTAGTSSVASTRTRHLQLPSSSHTFFGVVATCKAEKVDSLNSLPETCK